MANQVFVQTGSRQKSLVEIIDGIDAGDRIVVAGQNRLSNGVPVTLVGTDAPEVSPESESEAEPETGTLPPEPERGERADNNAAIGTGAAQAAEAAE